MYLLRQQQGPLRSCTVLNQSEDALTHSHTPLISFPFPNFSKGEEEEYVEEEQVVERVQNKKHAFEDISAIFHCFPSIYCNEVAIYLLF